MWMSKEDLAKESEELINELEDIYRSGNWREDSEKVLRVDEIKARLGQVFEEAKD